MTTDRPAMAGTPCAASGVQAVVLNWHGAERTIRCLESLRRGTVRPGRVIVCDNGSQDDSLERLRSYAAATGDMAVDMVAHGANLGYAAGNNPGLRLALERASPEDLIWILNNDVTVAPEALASLLQAAQGRPDVGLWGATVVRSADGRLECAGGFAYQPWTTVIRPLLAGVEVREAMVAPQPTTMAYVHGAAMAVRAEVFQRVGLLEERFFLFCEELDFCQRARAAGYALGWARECLVTHEGGASVGGYPPPDPRLAALVAYHETLSPLLFTRRHHPGKFPVALAARLGGKLAMLVRRGQWRLVAPVLAAGWAALRRPT